MRNQEEGDRTTVFRTKKATAQHKQHKQHRQHEKVLIGGMLAALVLVGCAGGDEGQEEQRFSTLTEMTSAFQAPTGVLSAENVLALSRLLEQQHEDDVANPSSIVSFVGVEGSSTDGAESVPCLEGGSFSPYQDEEQRSTIYRECTMFGCTTDGAVSWFQGTQDGYSDCISVDLDMDCDDFVAFSWETYACSTDEDTMVFLVRYREETFTVSGTYSGGSGRIQIGTRDGLFVCQIDEEQGTCSNEAGQSFSF